MKNSAKRPLAISLFSGAGGMDLGMAWAGFETVASVEIDENCCSTLAANFGERQEIFCGDARKIDPVDVRKTLRRRKLTLLYGGPPCQSFSQIGGRRGIEDERGLLVFQMARYAEALQPKVILMEQVKGFVTANGRDGKRGGVKDELTTLLESLGYNVSVSLLNAADYGVPQTRQRIFVIATKQGIIFRFPEATHSRRTDLFAKTPWVAVREALSKLPPVTRDKSDAFNHIDVTPERDRLKISYVEEGKFLANSEAPQDLKGNLTKKDSTKYLRLHRNKPSNTLRCGEIFYHPTEDRYLTPREYLRIHTFDDSFKLVGPVRSRSGSVKNLDQHRQVANAVPPLLAQRIGESILKAV